MIVAEIRVFWHALAVQQRVIGALFMREFMTRWGRRTLGFAWLFAEPLVFALPVITMWSMIRACGAVICRSYYSGMSPVTLCTRSNIAPPCSITGR
jgi:ABC-type polysaccharide/polyol phosphate export permease